MLRRRIWHCVREEKLRTISGFQEKALHDPGLHGAVGSVTVHQCKFDVSRPGFLPGHPSESIAATAHLSVHPHLAWGSRPERRFTPWPYSSTRRESMIVAGFMPRTSIPGPCARPGKASFPYRQRRKLRRLSPGWRQGRAVGLLHLLLRGGRLAPALLKNIVFAQHNLVTDSSFNEFNFICCRNVLIYFNKSLQDRCISFFMKVWPRSVC